MKFLFASDSFRGALSSERITQLLEAATGRTFPGCETAGAPVTDGGRGTIDVVISALNGTYRRLTVHGSLMEGAQSFCGEFEGGSAITEMVTASGLPTVPADRHNPLNTTAYDTGELIRDALNRGYREISIAVGGSATNNGGVKAIHTLGVRFLDNQGNEPEGKGRDLTRVTNIDVSRMHPAVAQTEFTVMCDMTNPLTEPGGATYTFEKRKSGTPGILDVLKGGMIRYAVLLKERLGVDVDKIPGTSATGGLGAALYVFLKANLRSDIDTVLGLVHSDNLLEGVNLVITGEDGVDWQSTFGKVPSGIGKRCRERGIPVAAIVGGTGDKAETIFDYGIDSIMTTINNTMDIEGALERAGELYISAADCTFRMLKAGMNPGRK